MKPFTVEEVAELFQVHVMTVRDWLRTGELIGSKIGKRWFVDEDSIKKKMHHTSVQEHVGKARIQTQAEKQLHDLSLTRNIPGSILGWGPLNSRGCYLLLVEIGMRQVAYPIPMERIEDYAFDADARDEVDHNVRCWLEERFSDAAKRVAG